MNCVFDPCICKFCGFDIRSIRGDTTWLRRCDGPFSIGACWGLVGFLFQRRAENLGFREEEACGCAETAVYMNMLGYQRCKDHETEIIDRMRKSAKNLGVIFIESIVRGELKLSIDQAEELTYGGDRPT
jgi:hypothetical protein